VLLQQSSYFFGGVHFDGKVQFPESISFSCFDAAAQGNAVSEESSASTILRPEGRLNRAAEQESRSIWNRDEGTALAIALP
jgi:hypothetical protein